MGARKALEPKYIEAVRAVCDTGLFTYAEIGKMFYISRTTVKRYVVDKVKEKIGA